MPRVPLKEIVTDIRSLRPLPAVVTKVLEIGSREDAVPDELLDVMRTDMAITCTVLKVCNSAYYGFQREVGSLREAGNMLGVSTLVNLVLTCGANRYFRDHGEAAGCDPTAVWRRCLTHALSSKLIADKHRKTDPERAYTAGLLQDVGRLVLDRYYDDGRVHVDAAVEKGETRIDAERDVLGMSHAEVGARLLARWELPQPLVDTVRHHHKPAEAVIDPLLASTTHLAETVGTARLAGDRLLETYEIDRAALELTGLELADFDAIEADLLEEVQRAGDMLVA